MKLNPAKIQGLRYDAAKAHFYIKELEVSITSKCHLRCDNCGFYIPEQPHPAMTKDVVSEITFGLSQLARLNIHIGSLAILGGEPSFNSNLLTESLKACAQFENIDQIEVVSHGLTPQFINKEAFKYIDKLTISVYFDNQELRTLWKQYIKKVAPDTELSLRVDKEWDQWISKEIVTDEKAQEMFTNCWYRKHCVTLERQRLFMCSRIPKLANDKEGIRITEQTTIEDIEKYLNQETFTASCKTCTPMMGLKKVKAGQQPDDRIQKMIPKAINYLTTALHE